MGSGDFGPRLSRTGDFGRHSVISDGDFGLWAVKSDGDFGRCAVNSDAQLSSLLYHYFGTNIVNFGWLFRTVILNGIIYKEAMMTV